MDDEAVGVTIYEPYRRGVPSLAPYLSDLWRRRRFLLLLARLDLKSRNYNTVIGQAWLILNPLLLAGAYFLMITVVCDGEREEAELMATLTAGLFVFYFTRNCIQLGGLSLLRGQRLLLNARFPRSLLPTAAVVTAFLMFVPTLPVYLVVHGVMGRPWTAALVMVVPVIALQAIFNLGLALFVAALTVYVRDTTNIIPYALRIWLYLTPVLFLVSEVPQRLAWLFEANPLYPYFAALQQALAGTMPSPVYLAAAAAWALAAVAVGGTVFISRERSFASVL